jgi:hypothetical protein
MSRLRIAGLLVLSVLLAACGGGGSTSNQNPVISSVTANPTSLAPGASSTITVVASDPNGDSLTYTYSGTNGTVSGTGATATFLAGSAAGTATVSVIVNDGRGGIVTGSVNVTIVQPAPVIDISAQVVKNDQGIDCLLFRAIPKENLNLNSVKITNPLGDSITYNLNGTLVLPATAIDLQASGVCYGKFSGEYTFFFTGIRPGGSDFKTTTIYPQP